MKLTIVLLIALAACHAAGFEAGNGFSRQDAKAQSSEKKKDSLSAFAPLREMGFSWGAVIAANAADAASSWHRYELNPVLGSGSFGARQAAIKGGGVAGAILAEWLIVRKYPRSARVFRVLNFADAGVTFAVAGENMRTR